MEGYISMNISAETDYAIRAMLYLSAIHRNDPMMLATTEEISKNQAIPHKFLEAILRSLKKADLIEGHRGNKGGFRLKISPNKISLADIIRVVDGPLAAVKGERPESVKFKESSKHLTEVWIALRVSMRKTLEGVTLAQIESGQLPTHIKNAIAQPEAWKRRN